MIGKNKQTESDRAPKLALRPREAAGALGISPRLLWTLTKNGDIPHTKIGRAVVYPVDRLREWLAARCRENGAAG